jgi:hypothetical protein
MLHEFLDHTSILEAEFIAIFADYAGSRIAPV